MAQRWLALFLLAPFAGAQVPATRVSREAGASVPLGRVAPLDWRDPESGIVVQRLNFGIKVLVVDTPFQVDMNTSRPAGHGVKQRLFGLSITGFCEPSPWRICKAVRPIL